MARAIRRTEVTECRQCATVCDRVIRPASCVAAACPALYQYDEPLTGRRFMGCLHKVFATEIDVELFRGGGAHQARLRRGQAGRARRCAAARSRSSARSPGESRSTAVVNRRFFDWPDAGSDAMRAFDLRDRL